MRTKTLHPALDILWRSVVFGLAAMILIALFIGMTTEHIPTRTAAPEDFIWTEEPLTEIEKYRGYRPAYAFPLFPAVYNPMIPLGIQLLWQCGSCILAAAGILLARYIIRENRLSFWLKLLLAPVAVLTGFISLLLQLRLYNSESLSFWVLFGIVLCTLLFTFREWHIAQYRVEEINAKLTRTERPRSLFHLFSQSAFTYVEGMYSIGIWLSTGVSYFVLTFVTVLFVQSVLGGSPLSLRAFWG